ncbi:MULTISPECIES: Uma2 family endonuclease [unclassified Roseofilum]|uniref:Uma2 family endonuclease n=1 Tax=unclassified Roseofilum TaxID=2620099 RepID=UPI001B06873B|nr:MULTISPECIES: Uma2 family endonuclease [unclassified Roseofilum]MBP0008410.1 Uma2 family endonuclease [Roseofilum sp. Belize Diploria]MBP0015610.1 Uma2 family endonuclease [Roseofilum sp. SID3]MBP0024080.1 Uma2 family endonuclease [Roseofilum sp. SID2]MBP0033308.1 Uma2 family endonuclease [Roseofilum sp. Belize BBD 4]MBP0040194.1 Uma2 family endonuclease [Roseofilum sp. SID1]
MLLNYNPRACLPSAEDLPDSDDTPVDNELQDLIPSLLKAMLALIWAERMDWFFGVDMGIYYDPNQPAIVPDGFLSVGVPRIIDSDLRLSYVLWEEQKLPTLVLEVVSHKRRKEYTQKKEEYAQLGILYYAIYNPLRKRKQKLEVYELNGGEYELLSGQVVWLSQLNLGIGKAEGTYQGITREWLYWYDEQGERYLTPEERIISAQQQLLLTEQRALSAQQQALSAQQKTEKLAQKLRELGIDPDRLDP